MNKQLETIKKSLYESLDEKISKLEIVREKIDNLNLPTFPINPKADVDLFRDLNLVFPYDPQIIKEIREIMKSNDWYEIDMIDSSQSCSYYNGNNNIDIKFSVQHEESTCVQTKIGEKQNTIGIYEITCKDGAEEKTFIQEKVEEKTNG